MKRRVIVFTILMGLLLSLALLGGHATAQQSGVRGRVISDGLRVRSQPSSTAAQVGLLKAAEFVTVIGKNQSGTWLLIESDSGVTGWVGSPYVAVTQGSLRDVQVVDENAPLSTPAPDETAEATAEGTEEGQATEVPCPDVSTPEATGVRGRVISDGLRVRDQPSSTGAQVGLLKAAEFVNVLGKNQIGTWLLIESDSGLAGWVGSAYIAVTEGSLRDVPVRDESAPLPAATPCVEGATAEPTVEATEAGDTTPTTEATEAAGATPAAGAARGRVISDGLRVRSQPSNTSAQVGLLKAAEFVTVLGKNQIGTWLFIRSDSGLTGWVGSAYIALTEGNVRDIPVTTESAP